MSRLEEVYTQLQALFPPTSTTIQPLHAAVTVLWRKQPRLEVFLARRALTLRFLPGFWTFPGGKVERSDTNPASAGRRELEEETGVRVHTADMEFAGRWVTPPISPLRFDTSYYLVEIPNGQTADVSCSEGELIGGCWWQPAEALASFEAGTLLIPAPVIRALRALESGTEGAQERFIAAAEAETNSERLWPLVGGIAISPLRTPTLPPATHTNCVVVGNQELILIDPASPVEEERLALLDALRAAEAQGKKVVEIWLTHHHADHTGAAEFFSDHFSVPICAHALTAERLGTRCRVDRHLAHGHKRILAGSPERQLECIHTPGHAPGHLCFLEHHTQSVIAGDMVAATGSILIDPSEGDMQQYLDSLESLRALKPRILIPAHGFVLTEPEVTLREYREHRLMREDRVIAALGPKAQSLGKLVEQVYFDTPSVLHPLAERSLLAHLIKLQNDGRASEVQSGWLEA